MAIVAYSGWRPSRSANENNANIGIRAVAIQKISTPPANTPTPAAAPNSPVSTHYPILLLAFGPPDATQTGWSIRIGIKGPERMDRPNYPPVTLEPIDVQREGTNDAWTYRAKDSATGADVSVHLTREACAPANDPNAKYTFRAVAQHGQLGTLNGCARIAAELFPKINNQPDPDDEDKIPAVLPADIIKFQSPTAIAYITGTKVVVGLGKIRKVAAQNGTEPSLSHDGKKLLYTRPDTTTGPERTIVLYDTTTGRSQDLVPGGVREAFWSPDDTRVAYLNYQDQKWQLYVLSVAQALRATRHGSFHRQPDFPARLGRRAHAARQRHAKRLLDHRRRPHRADRPAERNLWRHVRHHWLRHVSREPHQSRSAARSRALHKSSCRRPD